MRIPIARQTLSAQKCFRLDAGFSETASALIQGLADGYFIIPYTIGDYLATLPNYFSASADYSLALVEAFLRNMVDRSDAMAERVERFKAALRFDRACCECHRDFRFRNPGRRSRPGPVPRGDWETMMLQPAEPPMRVVRIPEDVAVAAGLTSNPPCGQALPDPGGCERTYLIHRRGFARVGHVAGRVLEIAARQESRTLGEIAATLKLSSPDLGQATGELQALAREGVIDLI